VEGKEMEALVQLLEDMRVLRGSSMKKLILEEWVYMEKNQLRGTWNEEGFCFGGSERNRQLLRGC